MNALDNPMGLEQERSARSQHTMLADDAHEAHPTGDACMFCDDTVGLARSGEDPLAFRDHLARHDHCQREYQLWKQVITDEWLGD